MIATFALLPAGSALANTITVTSNGDTGPGTLRQAILDSAPGETIAFSAALAHQTITLTSGELGIDHSLTITGLGAGALTVSGDNLSRVFDINASGGNVSISGLTITDGKAPTGPGNLDGGGILLRDGTLNLSNATVSGNKTTGTGNTTGACTGNCGSGGGIAVFDTATLTNVTVSGNSTDPTETCGGVANEDAFTLTIVGSAITGNHSGWGAGVCTEGGGNVVITRSTISGNTAQGAVVAGKAIAAEGGGFIEDGGGTTTITSSTISANTVYGSGGGVSEDGGGTIDISGSTLSGNIAHAVSGGSCVYAGPNYPTPCAAQSNGVGGGLAQDGGGTLDIAASSITGSQATGFGAGAGGVGAGTFDLTNSTVHGNTTTGIVGGFGVGGGFTAEHVTLQSDTIDSNSGSFSGNLGVNGSGNTITVRDTIVSRGSTNCGAAGGGTITSLGHNLDDGHTCGFTGSGDLQNTAPSLGAPAGTPAVLPELPGSPTIDRGDAKANCPATDERGQPRPDAGEASCDIGAYEFQDSTGGGTAVKCTLKANSARVPLHNHKKKKVKKGVLKLTARCDHAVTIRIAGTVTERKSKKRTKKFKLRRVTVALAANARKTIVIKLPAGALKGLSHHKKESAKFTLTVTGPGASSGSVTLSIGRLKGKR